ncbi:MAG TPA: RNA methyltransferase [Rhodocyclaceae bacterium]|nr:RNA methyltransferase [Rhodocyclaceae bacterium]
MKHIASRDNVFFKQLKRLGQSARERAQAGQTLLDGVHLIRAYETAVGPVDALLISESAQAQVEIAAYVAGREVVTLHDALFREAAVVETPSGIMAVVSVPSSSHADPAVDTVVLDGIQDPGNLGTLLRTAAAAGFRQVVLSPDCAGAWSPKVLRAGQGAHFVLDIVHEERLAGFLASYQGTVAVTRLEESRSLFSVALPRPLAWVFGSEGQGVRPEVAELATLNIRIPMPGAVESLNVAAAAAICLFETVRQRGL